MPTRSGRTRNNGTKTKAITQTTSASTISPRTVRRFRRWLNNEKIVVHDLYGPLIQQALADWGEQRLYLALDTSQLWDKYCIVRISVVFRSRAQR